VLAAAGGLGRNVGFWLKFGTFPYFVENHGQRFMAFATRRAPDPGAVGEKDTLIPMKHGQDLVGALEGASFQVFPDCGHYLTASSRRRSCRRHAPSWTPTTRRPCGCAPAARRTPVEGYRRRTVRN